MLAADEALYVADAHYKPGVNPNRNGWYFWNADDGSGRLLQSIREIS